MHLNLDCFKTTLENVKNQLFPLHINLHPSPLGFFFLYPYYCRLHYKIYQRSYLFCWQKSFNSGTLFQPGLDVADRLRVFPLILIWRVINIRYIYLSSNGLHSIILASWLYFVYFYVSSANVAESDSDYFFLSFLLS